MQARLTARRAAVEAIVTAQRQLHALVVTAPEAVRARFRGQSTRLILTTATRLRPTTSADVEVFTTLTMLRELAHRVGSSMLKRPHTRRPSGRSSVLPRFPGRLP
ncbi:hypothetical protein [Micromonospora echinaurantiaca]|uniref:hypothetical protein n=1 Tax=Micromonospora echinaurantiaca TaxID=47857 RepID=UPI0018D51A9E|nr:hypothetical protein [Micromonospora echinaurantiaca]